MIHVGPHFPTYIGHGTATSPDKIFCNTHHYLNSISEPGQITTSDHLPIIFKLSTKPFLIKQQTIYNFSRANWELFEEILYDKIKLNSLNNCTMQEVEEETIKWMTTVKDTMNKTIPTKTHKRITNLVITQEIKDLEREFSTLKKVAEVHSWTIHNYINYLRIRDELKEKCKAAHNRNWKNKINNIIEISKDSKAFWNQIKLLKGKNIIHANYMEDEEGNKYYSDKEKCTVMEKTWRDIFRITEEEGTNYDTMHSNHVNSYINIQQCRIHPYNKVDLNRLDNEKFLTKTKDKEEIKRYIRRSKRKAPGSSRINQLILEKCPEKAIKQLNNIYNACYSAGYFPEVFKQAIIKSIPKENKSPLNPLRYRPISLLEVPGKIFEKNHTGKTECISNRE